MAFDKPTRNALAKMVGECRRLLTADIRGQLQGAYGLQPDGSALPLASLGHLDEREMEIAGELREWQQHLASTQPRGSGPTLDLGPWTLDQLRAAFDRMAHETAFTVLNRLAALRLCEERGHTVECVRRGMESDGFRVFERLCEGALGGRGETYRLFIERMFDELAVDLPALFDLEAPQSLVFPRERCLEEVLRLLNDPALAHLWPLDETIGWIYQYFNPKELREAIKKKTKVPRNSHEIALRSSYYTPRFVVEFLTDNTLGRIWYEMRQGETRLKDDCRYLVHRPDEVFVSSCLGGEIRNPQSEIRNRKDPRDLKVLDPACGSGHFLLYAFDLLETIYQEAWQENQSPALEATGRTLRQDCADLDELRREIPALILRHNLHGIDIDPRACQIAALALWLRAQRSYHGLGLKPADRPRITRSNIVCAEPMPGEPEMLEEFVAGLRPKVLGQLVRQVFDKMKLAGEAGSLLKIEEQIRDAVAEAKRQWLAASKPEQLELLPGARRPKTEQAALFDVSGITDEEFWTEAEARVIEALQAYAERAANGRGFTRRLFADDAEQGFAFIDLCRTHYDVVLMNPPYAETEGELQAYLKCGYPENWTNLYSAFMERGMTVGGVRVGLVCPHGFLSAYRMRNLRSDFISRNRLESLSCLGKDVFDEMGLSTIAMVLNSRGSTLHPVLVELSEDGPGRVDYVSRAVVNERTNYILTPDLIRGSSTGWSEKPLSPTFGLVTQGNRTFDDFRFVRVWWEVSPNRTGDKWQRWQKGGEYQPFFSSTPYVTDWEKRNDGASMRWFGISKVGTDAQVAQSSRYWWRSGLVGPAMNTTGAGFNVRILPKDQIFSAKSTVIIPKSRKQALVLLSLLNSRTLRWFLYQQGAGLAGNTGKLKKLPVIWPDGETEQSLESLAQDAASLIAELESFKETSPCFKECVRPHVDLVERYRECADRLDATVSDLYRQEVEDEAVKPTPELAESALIEATDGHILKPHGDSLLSYCLGIAFGRWDVRIALDPSLAPKLPDSFDPLPVCPPGMLVGPEGLPAESGRIVSHEWLRARPDANTLPPEGSVRNPPIPDDGYPLRVSWDGILVDDPGENGAQPHQEDIVRRVREVLTVIWGERAEAIEQEACEILEVKSLRDYFRKPGLFFADHLKRYSKSRRQAPIYWPLSTASGSYALWIYYHRLTDQTLFAAADRYVGRKIEATERWFRQIEADLTGASGRKAAELRQAFEEAKTLLDELATFRDELLRVANLPYKPDLNDGVLITAAPLWKLFRLPKWRKVLEECWRKLEAGEYDWAHLACSIWPERVREKCKQDRSLAIAHGLEALCSTQRPKAAKARRKKKAESTQIEM